MTNLTPTTDDHSVPLIPIKPNVAPLQPMTFQDMVQMQLLTKAVEVGDLGQGSDDDEKNSLLPPYLQNVALAMCNMEHSGSILHDFMKTVAANDYMMKALNDALHSISNFPAMKAYLDSMSKYYTKPLSNGGSGNAFGVASVGFMGLQNKADTFNATGNDQQKQSQYEAEVEIIQNGSSSMGSEGTLGLALKGKFDNDVENIDNSCSSLGQAIATIAESLAVQG